MTPTSNGWVLALLILIAVIAVMVIAGMIYGRRQAYARHRAEEAAAERAEEAGIDLPEAVEPVAAEINADPVPKAPDPDLPVKAEPEPALAQERSAAPAAPPEPLRTPPPPAPEPEPGPVEGPPLPERDPLPAPRETASPPVPAAEATPAANLTGALSLTTIKGLGPKVAAMLAERGITRVDQIAALTADQARQLDVQLGAFTGRMARDRWIEQAKLLTSGDTAGYEAEFGKLG